MLFSVTAIAVDPETGDATPPRTEIIDTETNELFDHCRSEWEIEDAYEAFWNRLSSRWESDYPAGKEKVKVIKVVAA